MITIKVEITNKPFAIFFFFSALFFLQTRELASDQTTLSAQYPPSKAVYSALTVTGQTLLAVTGGSVSITTEAPPSAAFTSSTAKLKIAGEMRAQDIRIKGQSVVARLTEGNSRITLTRNADGSYAVSGSCN